MCTIAIEAVTPLFRTSRINLYKNIARSRLFRRKAKRSILKLQGEFASEAFSLNAPKNACVREGGGCSGRHWGEHSR